MPIAITLHLLAAVVWVGGMFFAYVALRPVAASLLPPPLRLPLWSQTVARFFPWVWGGRAYPAGYRILDDLPGIGGF